MNSTELSYGIACAIMVILLIIWMRYERYAVNKMAYKTKRVMKNPLCSTNRLRWEKCICGSGHQVMDCHGREEKISMEKYNEIIRIGKKYAKKAREQQNGNS